MKGHPGGQENTRQMLALAALSPGASVLDMGAGAGETVDLLRSLGYAARGIDLAPRSELVEQGDMHATDFPSGSFDAVLSQCAFYVSGDVDKAIHESHRLLKPGGRLLLADVFFQAPETLLTKAGFRILHAMDMTIQWREYYLEALWRDDECCPSPGGKCSYWLLICRKE